MFNTNLIIWEIIDNSRCYFRKYRYTWLSDWDIFLIYKNNSSNKFELKVWNTNSSYRYINKHWEKIENINTYNKEIFIREFQIKNINFLWENKNIYTANIKKYIK